MATKKPDRYNQRSHHLQFRQLILGSLLGIGVVSTLQMIGQPVLDTPLLVALTCFAISIPLLTCILITDAQAFRYRHMVYPLYVNILLLLACFLSCIGLCGIFWHFNWLIGATFLLSTALSVVVLSAADDYLKRLGVILPED
jgi:hypothetical protein